MQKVCPTDGTPLMEMNKNGVTIDVCPECKGVWLDRGELEKLIQAAIEIEREYGDVPRRVEPRDHDRDSRYDPRRESGYEPRRESGYDARRESGYDPRYGQPYQQPQYRRDDDDDDYRYGKKKKSTLGRLFDIFD